MAREEGVGPLAPLPRVRDAGERPGVPGQEPFRRGPVRADRDPGRTAFIEYLVDHRSLDPLEAQFLADRPFATRPCAVTRLHPYASEGRVVEHPELSQAPDRAMDEVRLVARAGEATTHFRDGSRARLEEPGGGLQNDGRVVDGRPAFAPFGE